jgi:hypothetical protein
MSCSRASDPAGYFAQAVADGDLDLADRWAALSFAVTQAERNVPAIEERLEEREDREDRRGA